MIAADGIGKWRKQGFALLEEPGNPWLNGFLIALIGFNVLAFVLESIPEIGGAFIPWFDALLYFSLVVFSLEYGLRLWVCREHDTGLYSAPVKGRFRFALTPLQLLDLIVLLPVLLVPIGGVDLRFLRLIRLLWLLKITRYLPAMASLGRVLKRERRTLAAVFSVMILMLFIASALVYLLEHERQPEAFGSILQAMWWAMATLTTVGYGDLVPITPLGKLLGVVIMMLGIGTFALPAGVLASAFAEERKRRDFFLTWDLVAQVPAFARLNAQEIARIATLLHPRQAMCNEVILRKGDDADSMFFVVSGEVKVEVPPEPVRLRKGDFFGEVAVLFHRKRSATVVALAYTELLELDVQELHRLFLGKPELRAKITEEAERRLHGCEDEQEA